MEAKKKGGKLAAKWLYSSISKRGIMLQGGRRVGGYIYFKNGLRGRGLNGVT